MKKKKQSSLKEEYKKCFSFLKESKKYVWASLSIFIFFILIGTMFTVYEEGILKLIEELFSRFDGLNTSQTIFHLFGNNVQASLFSIIFGIFLGIMPLIALILNGYLIGFIAIRVVSAEGILVLWRLIPHGIFEIPAFIISTSFGLKIGLGFLKKESFKRNLKESLRFFFLIIVPLLIIAAIIEGLLIFLVN